MNDNVESYPEQPLENLRWFDMLLYVCEFIPSTISDLRVQLCRTIVPRPEDEEILLALVI